MSSLSARFRQVEVTLAAGPGAAAEPGWPSEWTRREVAGNTVRFVESKFEQERTSSEIRRVFGEAPQVSIQQMPLRAIFLTLARHSRKAA